MRIPAKFRANGLEWSVIEGEVEDVYAITTFKKQTILIEQSLPQQLKEQTFLHELLHVVIWSAGLDTKGSIFEDTELEERTVNSMANGLYQVLNDNGLLNKD